METSSLVRLLRSWPSTRRFNLVDNLSVGVDRIQRNFEPVQRQAESWRDMWKGRELAGERSHGCEQRTPHAANLGRFTCRGLISIFRSCYVSRTEHQLCTNYSVNRCGGALGCLPLPSGVCAHPRRSRSNFVSHVPAHAVSPSGGVV